MSCKSKVILRLAIVATLLGARWGHAGTAADCSADAYRAFDFWLGRWEVRLEDGRLAGTNRIRASRDGCLLTETWTSEGGGDGFSMNFYDPVADQWRQVWVSTASVIEIAGGLEEDAMVLSGEITYRRTGDVRPFRGRWTPLPDGRVRQSFEEFRDGEGWQTWFDGIYTKVLE